MYVNWQQVSNMIGYKKSFLERQSFSEVKLGKGSLISKKKTQKHLYIVKLFQNNLPQFEFEYVIIYSTEHHQIWRNLCAPGSRSKVNIGCQSFSGPKLFQKGLKWKTVLLSDGNCNVKLFLDTSSSGLKRTGSIQLVVNAQRKSDWDVLVYGTDRLHINAEKCIEDLEQHLLLSRWRLPAVQILNSIDSYIRQERYNISFP